MELPPHDILRILHPEPLTPEQEARRQAVIERSRRLGELTPERLEQGIPIEVLETPTERERLKGGA